MLVPGLRQANVFIHIDDSHHFPGMVRCVFTGPMKCPARMEAYISKRKRTLFKPELGERLLQNQFALVADFKVTAKLQAMTFFAEGKRPHFERRVLQGYPSGDDIVISDRPVILVSVPRGDAAARFFIERLVMINPHAATAHQFRCDPGEALSEDEFPDHCVRLPQVHDL